MFCSTIIPTIGRETLSRAVNSALCQNLSKDSYEVIVVNDSGQPLKFADWHLSDQVTIINTNQRERSVARNTGAAIARGLYLHFLDDDDWLLPGGLESLWNCAKHSKAKWVYGSTQLVDRKGKPLIKLRHNLNDNCLIQVLAGEWIPLQSSIIETRAFFKISGFDPNLPPLEDIDLCRRVAQLWDLVEIPEKIACISMGPEGSTSNFDRSFESRRALQKILEQQGVFHRMYKSANSSYWFGRLVRVYLASAYWHINQKKYCTAGIRLAQGIATLGLTFAHIISRDYWKAILRPYESDVFLRGFEEITRSVEQI